jgi:hypothetical protein
VFRPPFVLVSSRFCQGAVSTRVRTNTNTDQRTEDFLKDAPDHPMRSRLEPHRELIRELRRKRYPYRKIVAILRDHFAVQISKSALHDFVKVRSRSAGRGRVQPAIPPSSPSTLPSRAALGPGETSPIIGQAPSPSPDTQADIYARIDELKRRKRTPVPEPNFNFHYEEGEPLRFISEPNKTK